MFSTAKILKTVIFLYFLAKIWVKGFQHGVENCVENFTDGIPCVYFWEKW